jgi:glycosyltransferase involved in cell wall biosynthesis
MRSIVMSMLDLDQEPNQRTHHVLRALAEVSSETVLVTKVRALGRSTRELARDALRWSVTERSEGTVRTLRVHPFLNYAHALAAGLVHGQIVKRPAWHRRALATTLSVCGIARDFFLVPAFVLAVLTRTRGTFDVCVAENPWTGVAALVLKALKRVRHVVYDDMDYVAGGQLLRFRRAYVALLERTAIWRADLTVCAGWTLGAYRRKTTGRDVLIIPNGADPRRFASAHARVPHPPTLVYVGFLAYSMGIDLAIDALPLIHRKVPDARLVVVGDGDAPYFEGLRELARARGVAGSVEFRGRVPYEAVPLILAESDIGLSTLRDDPLGVFAFPLKVVEYFSAGLPTLCSRGTEGEEILRRHPAGRAVAFDAAELAAAAVELFTQPAVYERAREAALRAAQVFTWDRAMQQERDAILALVAGRGSPAAVKAT